MRWERKYIEEGPDRLYIQGYKSQFPKITKSQDLIAENQRLKMELEYLKKLNALVFFKRLNKAKSRSSSGTKATISIK